MKRIYLDPIHCKKPEESCTFHLYYRVTARAWACCKCTWDRMVTKGSFSHVTSRGAPRWSRTSPHSLWRAAGTRPGLRARFLASVTHLEPSCSSSAARPNGGHRLASGGIQHSQGPAAAGRRCTRASDAWLVEYVHWAYRSGVGSAPHHHPHVAPRSATTSTSE